MGSAHRKSRPGAVASCTLPMPVHPQLNLLCCKGRATVLIDLAYSLGGHCLARTSRSGFSRTSEGKPQVGARPFVSREVVVFKCCLQETGASILTAYEGRELITSASLYLVVQDSLSKGWPALAVRYRCHLCLVQRDCVAGVRFFSSRCRSEIFHDVKAVACLTNA